MMYFSARGQSGIQPCRQCTPVPATVCSLFTLVLLLSARGGAPARHCPAKTSATKLVREELGEQAAARTSTWLASKRGTCSSFCEGSGTRRGAWSADDGPACALACDVSRDCNCDESRLTADTCDRTMGSKVCVCNWLRLGPDMERTPVVAPAPAGSVDTDVDKCAVTCKPSDDGACDGPGNAAVPLCKECALCRWKQSDNKSKQRCPHLLSSDRPHPIGHVEMRSVDGGARRLEVHTVSRDPLVLRIPNMLSSDEIADIEALYHSKDTKFKVKPSETDGGKGKYRKSDQKWITADEVSMKLRHRFAAVVGLPSAAMEDLDRESSRLQLVQYKRSGHYACHLDVGRVSAPSKDKAGEEEDEDGEGEQRSTEVGASARVFTLLMQLRDLPGTDGATWFPALQEDGRPREHPFFANRTNGYLHTDDDEKAVSDAFCRSEQTTAGPQRCASGLRVPSRAGQALLWLNLRVRSDGTTGQLNLRALHAGCPVRKTTRKMIATQWFATGVVDRWCVRGVQGHAQQNATHSPKDEL